jgi:dTDP-4-dehydrorhamnose 3,5-epimerase-like enzyme
MAEVDFIDISSELHQDERGGSLFPWRGRLHDPQDLLDTFHLISINPGQTRGNHFHPGHIEWIYLFLGSGSLAWTTAAGAVQQRELSGNRTMVRIAPGVAHNFTNPGPETVYLLAWRERVACPHEPETVPRQVEPAS